MRIANYSDIHGNLPALELAIKDAITVDGYIILGDVVNYVPWNNECVALIDSLKNCTKLIGNHEEYFIEGKYGSDNFMANESFVGSGTVIHEGVQIDIKCVIAAGSIISKNTPSGTFHLNTI